MVFVDDPCELWITVNTIESMSYSNHYRILNSGLNSDHLSGPSETERSAAVRRGPMLHPRVGGSHALEPENLVLV